MVWNLNGLISIAGATNFVFGRKAVLYVWLLELLMICLSSLDDCAAVYLPYLRCDGPACRVIADCLPSASGEIIALSFSLLWGIEHCKIFEHFLFVSLETPLNHSVSAVIHIGTFMCIVLDCCTPKQEKQPSWNTKCLFFFHWQHL